MKANNSNTLVRHFVKEMAGHGLPLNTQSYGKSEKHPLDFP
jgi:hypothetical protein